MSALLEVEKLELAYGPVAVCRDISLRLGEDFSRRKTERLQFVPARLTAEGTVATLEFHGSAHLAAVLSADGFFQVPMGTAELKAGDPVAFSPLPRVFR